MGLLSTEDLDKTEAKDNSFVDWQTLASLRTTLAKVATETKANADCHGMLLCDRAVFAEIPLGHAHLSNMEYGEAHLLTCIVTDGKSFV